MDTTVTGIFKTRQAASIAVAALLQAGFVPAQVRVVDAATRDRHEFIDKKTSDTQRAILLGTVFGAVGGCIAGWALAGVLGWGTAAVVAVALTAGGALLGLVIGRSTKSQVRDELEHQVDTGTVLVSVTTDAVQSPNAVDVLAREGGSSMVSTAASFTAAVLPATPEA